mmetsp:Transcript_70499/g.127130  ORF Transcript_70499/g.127130 Transcript_70499/m.127130 type:complete len:202 (-) Transcript_70499:427-1032(-)
MMRSLPCASNSILTSLRTSCVLALLVLKRFKATLQEVPATVAGSTIPCEPDPSSCSMGHSVSRRSLRRTPASDRAARVTCKESGWQISSQATSATAVTFTFCSPLLDEPHEVPRLNEIVCTMVDLRWILMVGRKPLRCERIGLVLALGCVVISLRALTAAEGTRARTWSTDKSLRVADATTSVAPCSGMGLISATWDSDEA